MKISSNSKFLILFLLSGGVWSLGQLGRIQLSPDIALYAHDIIFVLVGLTNWQSLLRFWLTRASQLKLLFGLLSLSLIWAISQEGIVPLLYASRLFVYLSMLRLLYDQLSTYPELVSVKLILWSSSLIAILIGWVLYWLFPDNRALVLFGWDPHVFRMQGGFLDPNYFGLVCVISLYWLLELERIVRNIGVRLFWYLFILGALALSFSRASFLSMLVLLASYWIQHVSIVRTIKGISICLMFAGLLLLAPKPWGEGVNLTRTSTAKLRFDTLRQNISSLNSPKALLVGHGLFSQQASNKSDSDSHLNSVSSHAKYPDNFFILLLTQFGLIGVGVLTIVLIRNRSQLMVFLSSSWPILLAVLVHSQFNNSVLEPFMLLFWGASSIVVYYSLKETTKA